MIEEEGIDAVCIGEGEYSLIDLLVKLEHGEETETPGFG